MAHYVAPNTLKAHGRRSVNLQRELREIVETDSPAFLASVQALHKKICKLVIDADRDHVISRDFMLAHGVFIEDAVFQSGCDAQGPYVSMHKRDTGHKTHSANNFREHFEKALFHIENNTFRILQRKGAPPRYRSCEDWKPATCNLDAA